MSRKTTILSGEKARYKNPTKAPSFSEKKKEDPKKLNRNILEKVYPQIGKSEILIIEKVKWLDSKDPDYITEIQDVADAILRFDPYLDKHNELEIIKNNLRNDDSLESAVKYLEDLESGSVSLEDTIKKVDRFRKKEELNDSEILASVGGILQQIASILSDRESFLNSLAISSNFEEVRDSTPQYIDAEIAHIFAIESKLSRPRGVWEAIPCGKCGCHYYYVRAIQKSSGDEATHEIKNCVNCIGA